MDQSELSVPIGVKSQGNFCVDPKEQALNPRLGTSELTTKYCALAKQIYRLLTKHSPANVV